MPLIRYNIRNEYSLAQPELYRSSDKDDPYALLEGVAIAGVVGILRQLGDLAQFAAEIFHNLHEEIMATAAKGHELMTRVQQIEADLPSVEKALMSETNQLRFAHSIGADWQASIRNDQNHLTQSDLPRFIRNSYEECRGPPRLFVLDKFDIAGVGACLKRYTDPFFFKTKWASSELMKDENAEGEINTAKVKKRIRRQRNGETTGVVVTSQQNSRLHYSALDLAHPLGVPGNVLCSSNQILESKQWKKVPSAGLLLDDQTKDDLAMGQVTGFQSVKIIGKDKEATRACLDIIQTDEKFVFSNRERKPRFEDGIDQVDDVGNEVENFVDTLTTMESDIEVDSECHIKREVDSDINSEHRESGCQLYTKSHEQPAECSVFLNVQSAGSFVKSNSSTPSEDSWKQSSIIASVHASPESGEKGSTPNIYSGNHASKVATGVSSESGNIVWTTDASDYNNVAPFSPAAAAMNAKNTDFIHTSDAVMDRSSSFAFSNSELPSSLGCVNASADCREKELTADLDNGNCKIVVNSVSSGSSIVQTTYAFTEAVLDDHLDVKSFVPTACDSPVMSTSIVQKPETVLDRSSSFAFPNIELPHVSLNATPSARFDTEDAFFSFITPELSIMYNDENFKSPTLIEEPFTISESSPGVTDLKFQIRSSNIEKFEDSQLSFISGHSNRIKTIFVPEAPEHKFSEELENPLVPLKPPDTDKVELVAFSDVSKLASGFHDVQDEHSRCESDVDYVEHEIPGNCVSCEKTLCVCENSSSTPAGCISVESEVEETHIVSPFGNLCGKHSIELCADTSLDSMNAKVLESGIDIDSVCNRVLDVSSSGDALQIKSIQMHENLSDSSVIMSTKLNLKELEFSPDLKSSEVPVNNGSAQLLQNGESSHDMLGDEMISRFDNSKVFGTAHEIDFKPDILMRDIPVDLVEAELDSMGYIDSRCASTSSPNDCNGRALNEFPKYETEAFVIAESPDVSQYSMSPVAFFHSRSLVEPADAGSHNFDSTEPNSGPLAKVHLGRLDAMPAASSADNIIFFDHLHTELVTKHSVADFHSHHVGERQGGYAKEGSASSLSNANAQGHKLASSPQDQINVSYTQPAKGSSLCTSIANSDYYPETMGPERNSSVRETTNLSTFSMLPEPVIPLQKELEEKSISGRIPLLSNNFEKSVEAVIDGMQSLKLLYTVDDSSVSCNGHSMELAVNTAVLPGISLNTDEKLGSSRVPLISSLTDPLSPSTTVDSIMSKVNDVSLEAGCNFIQASPRSCTYTGPSFSVSLGNNSHDIPVLTSKSMYLGSEDLVSSSLIIESKIQGSVSQETPPPPPLPSLDWWVDKRHKISLPYTKLSAPPALPPSPSKHTRPVQNSQKTCVGSNDSLMNAIALHDKSTLRKVAQQSQSLKAKQLNEREELLKQIRMRSFSLRQAVMKKHDIPRPATNFNAILEKASAIRQAYVGSEDEEDDDWSDD